MTMLATSGIVSANGIVDVTIPAIQSGLQWAVGQMSLESANKSPNGQAEVRVNGRLYTSAQFLPMTASGVPALLLQSGEVCVVHFFGMLAGDTGEVAIWYAESHWGTIPNVAAM